MLRLTTTLLFFCSITAIAGRTDPEINMNVPQMLRYWGYPAEEHAVHTEDGYILTIHRIAHGRNEKPSATPKPVVFLQHCLLCSSSNWLSNLPNESLGYILADAGFDVWLGNVRGNTYGLRHKKLKPNQSKFWDFSWGDMARYDLPAMLNYVLNTTKMASLAYIGHSQGTLMAFAEFSTNNDLASKVNVFIALAPVATAKYITSPIKYIAPMTKDLDFLCKFLGGCGFDFLPSSALTKFFAQFVCGKAVEEIICSNIVFLMCGFDYAQLNSTRLPVYFSHTPAGTSVKNIIHYGQLVNSGKCQAFDYYNEKDNRAHYNQAEPPVYNMSNVDVPIVLYHGSNDWLADPKDVQLLTNELPKLIKSTEIPSYEHLDFIWGLDAAQLVYKPAIAYLRKFASITRIGYRGDVTN